MKLDVTELEEVHKIGDSVEELTARAGLIIAVDGEPIVNDPASDAVSTFSVDEVVGPTSFVVTEGSGCGKMRANSTPDPGIVASPDMLAK